jgi:antitoxin component YwqK of YwqJK toxin-antitoxin module
MNTLDENGGSVRCCAFITDQFGSFKMKRGLFFPVAMVILFAVTGCSGSRETAGIGGDKYIHKYGVEVTKSDWEGRGSDGKIISYLNDGSKLTRSYQKGMLHGDSTLTYPHSDRLKNTSTYENGRIVCVVEHNTSGSPAVETRYIGKSRMTKTTWYETGSPRSIENFEEDLLVNGTYYNEKNEAESHVINGEGLKINRNEFGELVSQEKIQRGHLVQATFFYPNGNPREIVAYERGIVHGLKKRFSPQGEPTEFEEWKSGVQHGETTVFVNGEKVAMIPYVNGVRHGIERRYRDGEIVAEEITWAHDVRHGPSRIAANGATRTSWYYEGRQVSKMVYDQMTGRGHGSEVR